MLTTPLILATLIGLCSGLVVNGIVNLYLCYYSEQKFPKKGLQILPIRFFLILLNALLFVIVLWRFGIEKETLACWLLSALLLALVWIDAYRLILPDTLCYTLIWGGLLVNSQGLLTEPHLAIWGAVCGYLLLWSCAHLFSLSTQRQGMGYGDFKLCAALGAWLGLDVLPQLVFIASFSGIIYSLASSIISARPWRQAIAFGPHLALAGYILLIWNKPIQAMIEHLYY